MSDEAAKRLAQLKAALQSGIIDDDTYRTAVAALSSSTVIQAALSGSGAIAQGEGAVAAGAGSAGDLSPRRRAADQPTAPARRAR